MKKKIFLTIFIFILPFLITCEKKGDCSLIEIDPIVIGTDTTFNTSFVIIPDLTEEECEEKGGTWTEN